MFLEWAITQVVDATHVEIIKPEGESAVDYFNQKAKVYTGP